MSIESTLEKILPAALMPSNVGKQDTASWPFWFNVDIPFSGTSLTVDRTFSLLSSFRVTQEANVLIMAISVATNIVSGVLNEKGYSAPLALTLRDRQSSRQFNDIPTPIQNYGRAGDPTLLKQPHWIDRNSNLEIQVQTILTGTETCNLTTTNAGQPLKMQVSFYGYRIRENDKHKIPAHVFALY
jgi:hypothetical protein